MEVVLLVCEEVLDVVPFESVASIRNLAIVTILETSEDLRPRARFLDNGSIASSVNHFSVCAVKVQFLPTLR